jgi:hypothetical protein
MMEEGLAVADLRELVHLPVIFSLSLLHALFFSLFARDFCVCFCDVGGGRFKLLVLVV